MKCALNFRAQIIGVWVWIYATIISNVILNVCAEIIFGAKFKFAFFPRFLNSNSKFSPRKFKFTYFQFFPRKFNFIFFNFSRENSNSQFQKKSAKIQNSVSFHFSRENSHFFFPIYPRNSKFTIFPLFSLSTNSHFASMCNTKAFSNSI